MNVRVFFNVTQAAFNRESSFAIIKISKILQYNLYTLYT